MKLLLELGERVLNGRHALFHTLEHFIHREHFFFALRFGHPDDVEVNLIALEQIFSGILASTPVRVRVRIKRLFSL